MEGKYTYRTKAHKHAQKRIRARLLSIRLALFTSLRSTAHDASTPASHVQVRYLPSTRTRHDSRNAALRLAVSLSFSFCFFSEVCHQFAIRYLRRQVRFGLWAELSESKEDEMRTRRATPRFMNAPISSGDK